MKPSTLALATFVALFGASASFGALANDPTPADGTQTVSGTLDPADPTSTPDEMYSDEKALAADTSDDDADDAADDDDTVAAPTDEAMTPSTATAEISTESPESQAERDVALRDGDRNGSLEAGEVSSKSELAARFAEFDLDANGSLTASEYQGWVASLPNAATAASDGSDTSTLTTTTTTTDGDATVMSSDNEDPTLSCEEVAGEVDRPSDAGTPDVDSSDDGTAGLTAQTEDEAGDTESEDVNGEDNRPSDAGTPDVDSDEEEAEDLDDNDD